MYIYIFICIHVISCTSMSVCVIMHTTQASITIQVHGVYNEFLRSSTPLPIRSEPSNRPARSKPNKPCIRKP